MKTIKYILIFALTMASLTSCLVDGDEVSGVNDDGPNVVTFDRINTPLPAVTNGDEYNFKVPIKIAGPTVMNLINEISVTVEIAEGTTATNSMYRINNLPIILSPENNYLGTLDITVLTEGNNPPQEGTPEFDAWVAPILKLNLIASGDPKVLGSGKTGTLTLNYSAPNPYAGDYTAHLIYRHPSYGDYPDNIYVEEDNDKTLTAITGRRSETWFATWDTDLCWITVNPDNSISFIVDETWPYDVKLGDPNRADLISHFDPDTRQIYLYYHYSGSGGDRIFWEVFTPKF